MNYKSGDLNLFKLVIDYKDLPDYHYFDINGHLNPLNSNVLWETLYYHNVIDQEYHSPREGLSYMVKYIASKLFRKSKKRLTKKVVLDFKDAVFDGVCAVAISLQARNKVDSQLEIWANERVVKTFGIYKVKGLFHIIDESSVKVR